MVHRTSVEPGLLFDYHMRRDEEKLELEAIASIFREVEFKPLDMDMRARSSLKLKRHYGRAPPIIGPHDDL